MLPTRLLTGLVKPSSAWPRTGATSLPGVVGAPSSLGRFEDDAGGCTAGLACSAAAAASRSTTPAKVRNVRLWPFIDVTLPRKEPRNYVTPALHFAVPILRLRIDRSEDLEVPLTAAPWLDDLGSDDVHEDLRKRTALGVAFEVISRLVPPEIRVEDHREKEIVAVVDDDDLSAGALDGRVIDQILLSAVRADVALERKLARDDLFDRDLLFPAVAAVALLAARLRHILGAAECTLRFDDIRLSGGHPPHYIRRQFPSPNLRRPTAPRPNPCVSLGVGNWKWLEIESWSLGVDALSRNSLAPHRGQIHFAHVILHHPPRGEDRQHRADRLLHDFQPAPRDAVLVARVERRHQLLFDERVDRLRIGPVLCAVIVRIGVPLDQPAVLAGEPFGPPAVTDRHVRRAVDRGLHAARATRFERLARVVQPHVAALHEVMGDVEVVVVDEANPPAELWIDGSPVDPLQMMLADVVCRVRLAGEDDLHRASGRCQNPRQSIRVEEDELGPLVSGEATCEPDRQRVVIEHRRGGDDASCADVFVRPAVADALAHEVEEERPQRLPRGPDLLVRNVHHPIGKRRVVVEFQPVRAEMPREDTLDLRGDPRWDVNAVGDRLHGQRLVRHAGPDRLPHLLGDFAVQPADAIH